MSDNHVDKWVIEIKFMPDEKGKLYELQTLKLTTKRMTRKRAKHIAVIEAEKCWPYYDIFLERK